MKFKLTSVNETQQAKNCCLWNSHKCNTTATTRRLFLSFNGWRSRSIWSTCSLLDAPSTRRTAVLRTLTSFDVVSWKIYKHRVAVVQLPVRVPDLWRRECWGCVLAETVRLWAVLQTTLQSLPVCPSVCLSCTSSKLENKKAWKTQNCPLTFARTGETGVPIFSSKVGVSGRPHIVCRHMADISLVFEKQHNGTTSLHCNVWDAANSRPILHDRSYRVGQKKLRQIFLAITLVNMDRF